MNYQTDITIVGGGMAGAALALALAQETQWNIALIDAGASGDKAATAPPVLASRVVSLNEASIDWLTRLGVWPELQAAYYSPYQKMVVWDGEGTGEVTFDAADEHQTQLGTIVENNHLLTRLWGALQATGRIHVVTADAVSDVVFSQGQAKHCVGLKSGSKFKASLVVAADGAESVVRTMAGLGVSENDYGHSAIVATVETQHAHDGVAFQRFSNTGPLAFLPLPSKEGKHYCSIVWSQQQTVADELLALDDAAFVLKLERAIEHRLGRVLSVHNRAAYPLKERHANSYYRAGLALIGDAAHTLHPLAGQGINLGFADAQALATELKRAQTRGLPLAEPSVLTRYQRQRRAHNTAAIKAMAAFKVLFEAKSPMVGLLRNEGMRLFNQMPWLKRQAIKVARGSL